MKKYVIAISVAAALAGGVWAGQPVVGLSASSGATTCADNPAVYAADGVYATSWRLADGADDGYLELRWSVPTLLSALDFNGSIAGNTRGAFWYEAGGVWNAFATARLDGGAGTSLIDVSGDFAVTTAIRLRLRGGDADECIVRELRVWGAPSDGVVYRMAPKTVSASDNTNWAEDADYLFDADTRTVWSAQNNPFGAWANPWPQVLPGAPRKNLNGFNERDIRGFFERGAAKPGHYPAARSEASITFEFAAANRLDAVKVFLPEQLRTQVVFEAEAEGKWKEIGRFNVGTPAGWNRLDVAARAVNASRLRLRAALGWTGGVAIGEIEVWGRGDYAGRPAENLLLDDETALASPANLSFSSAADRDETVEITTRGYAGAALPVELNGDAVAGALAYTANGRSVWSVALPMRALWEGANFLRIGPAAGFVETVRRRVAPTDGLIASGAGQLGDSWQLNAIDLSGSYVIPFGAAASVERVEVSCVGAAAVTARVMNGNAGTPLLAEPAQAGTVVFAAKGAVGDRLELEIAGTVGEIGVWGSRTALRGPGLRVNTPEYGERLSQNEIRSGMAAGFVGDREATVLVNDKPAAVFGNYFWIRLSDIGLAAGQPNVIKIVATDKQGRKTEQSIPVEVESGDWISFDQPDGIQYTNGAEYVVSGQIRTRSPVRLIIAGKELPAGSRTFKTAVPVTEGLNFIRVQLLQKNNGKTVEEAVFRVVRTSGISLAVDMPAAGEFVRGDSIVVRGRTRGNGDVAVTVNGVAAPVVAGGFSAAARLAVGPNVLAISARDQTGQTKDVEVRVVRDEAAPAGLSVEPADGAIVASRSVSVRVTAVDENPAWASVNGGPWQALADSRAEFPLLFAEGAQTINVRARDAAGNAGELASRITVDVTPPAAFAVAAAPAGWNNDTRPVISFESGDAVSGLDRYEAAIDGEALGAAASPYRLPLLSDGIHTVSVTAIDKAGWTTTAQTTVRIDTSAAPCPADFELVPGADKVELRWFGADDGEGFQTYRLERSPAWPDGIRAPALPPYGAQTFADGGLAGGDEYSYRVWAVDRAGNASPATAWTSARVGIAVTPIDPTEPTTIEYEDVVIVAPPDAVPDDVLSISVSEIQPEDIAVAPENPVVSKVIQVLAVRDEDGVPTLEEHVELEAPVPVEIAYDEAAIPAGYAENDLEVFYFDTMWGRWLPVENSVVDADANTVSFNALHFTDFSVQATKAVRLSPQQLRDNAYGLGSPTKGPGPVRVSEEGGTVSTDFTEMVLPGRNGFDLAIQRVYDTGTAQADAGENAAGGWNGETVWRIADGWRFDFPWMKWNGSGLWVKGPDGQMLSFSQTSMSGQDEANGLATVNLECHEASDLSLRMVYIKNDSYWINIFGLHLLEKTSYSFQSCQLILKDGRTVDFNQNGQVTAMRDATGQNTISFDYGNGSIARITDTLGRVVTIAETADTEGYSKAITVNVAAGGETYAQPAKYMISGRELSRARDVGGRIWNYAYSVIQLAVSTEKKIDVVALGSVNGPGIGTIAVTYGLQNFSYTVEGYPVSYERMVAREISTTVSAQLPVRRTQYAFTFAEGADHQFYTTQSTVDDGLTITTNVFTPISKSRRQYTDAPEAMRKVQGPIGERQDSAEIVCYRSRRTVRDKSNAAILERIEQAWNADLLRPSQVTVTKTEFNFQKTNYQYDGWGNVVDLTETQVVAGRTTGRHQQSQYYGTGSPNLAAGYSGVVLSTGSFDYRFKSLLAFRVTEITGDVPTDGSANESATRTATEIEYYRYDSRGQVESKNVFANDAWQATEFKYYGDTGELRWTKSPLGRITDLEYDYDFTAHPTTYVRKSIARAVEINVTETADITTATEYERLSGLPIREIDARGYETIRTYDDLDRPTSIVEPVMIVNNVGVKPTTTIVYNDDASVLTSTVTSPSGLVTVYKFDAAGRLVHVVKTNTFLPPAPEAQTELTETTDVALAYDQWDRVTEMRGPLSNFDTKKGLSLADLVTSFAYDALGRPVSVQEPGASARTMAYDNAAGSVTTTNEAGEKHKQILDWRGNVIVDETYPDGWPVRTRTWFDGAGRRIAAIDGEGNLSTIVYDERGLQATVTQAPRKVWSGDGETMFSPFTVQSYDADGFLAATEQTVAPDIVNRMASRANAFGWVIETTADVVVDGQSRVLTVRNEYDAAGNRTKESTGYDADFDAGKQSVQSWYYDSHGNTTAAYDPDEVATRFEYDASGNRLSLIDPRDIDFGRFRIDYRYDQQGRLIEATLPAAAGETAAKVGFVYDGRGNALVRREDNGQETVWTYDTRNLVRTETVKGGAFALVTAFDYDAAGRRILATAPSGNAVHTEYDKAGRVFRQGNAATGWTTFYYDNNGRVKRTVDGRNYANAVRYDPEGRVVEAIDAAGRSSYTWYDGRGLATRTKDAELNVRTFDYDALGRLVAQVAPWGARSTFTYDAWSQIVAYTDGRATAFTRTYTATHLPKTETAVNGAMRSTRSFEYDSAGALKAAVDNGIRTEYNMVDGRYQPDPFGQTRSKSNLIDGVAYAMDYGYDRMQRLTDVAYPGGSTTVEYAYDAIGRLDAMPDWIDGQLRYDDFGRYTGATYANGVSQKVGYDAYDRIATIAYRDDAEALLKSYAFGYDLAGNIVAKNANAYQYDALNRLVDAREQGFFQQDPADLAVRYGIADGDYTGNAAIIYSAASDAQVAFDYAARSIGVDLLETRIVNRIELRPLSGAHRVRARDLRVYARDDQAGDYREITGWRAQLGTDGSVMIVFSAKLEARYVKFATVWDDRDIDNAAVDSAQFRNALRRLVQVWTLNQDRHEAYGYDRAGNRVSLTVDGKVSLYRYYRNALGGNLPLLEFDGGWHYGYDGAGNNVWKAKAVTAGGGFDPASEYWTYAWDAYNRLIAVGRNGAAVAEYEYDADDLRVKRRGADGTTIYAYGRNGALTYQKNLATGAERRIAYLADRVVGWTERSPAGTETTYFAATDQLGSVTAVFDAGGAKVWESEYTPFGRLAGVTGTLSEMAFGGLFTGKDVDPDTGLVYMWHRWQNPDTGRFISEDPIRAGANFYAYVDGRVLVSTDPSGLAREALEKKNKDTVSNVVESTYTGGAGGQTAGQNGNQEQEQKTKKYEPVTPFGAGAHSLAIGSFDTGNQYLNYAALSLAGFWNVVAFMPGAALDLSGLLQERVIDPALIEVIGMDSRQAGMALGVPTLGGLSAEALAAAKSLRYLPSFLRAFAAGNTAKAGPGVWRVDTAAMSADARAWQGLNAYRVPWKTKPSATMRDYVDFDGWDSATSQLIDRKWNVTGFQKSVDQAQRQAALAQQYGLSVRWEVPANRLQAAQSLLNKASVGNIISVIVP